MMFPMTAGQFDLVYNSLSFTLASMMASTIFFWLRLSSVHEKYKSAMTITGLVTFIAAYHYIRIFNSWTESYSFPASADGNTVDPVLTGQPFNDAYRYMDWLLTVPLLLIEIIFCCNLPPAEVSSKAWALGVSSGLMIALGYPGEETEDAQLRKKSRGLGRRIHGQLGLQTQQRAEERLKVADHDGVPFVMASRVWWPA